MIKDKTEFKDFSIKAESGYTFHTQEAFNLTIGDTLGKLSYVKDKLVFEGDVDKSAKVFFDYLIKFHDTEIARYRNTLEKIARGGAMDYEYQRWAREVLNTEERGHE
jgi:hypothetical protein